MNMIPTSLWRRLAAFALRRLPTYARDEVYATVDPDMMGLTHATEEQYDWSESVQYYKVVMRLTFLEDVSEHAEFTTHFLCSHYSEVEEFVTHMWNEHVQGRCDEMSETMPPDDIPEEGLALKSVGSRTSADGTYTINVYTGEYMGMTARVTITRRLKPTQL